MSWSVLMPRAVKVCVSLLCPQISHSRLSLRKSRHLHRPKVSSVWVCVWVGGWLRSGEVCVCVCGTEWHSPSKAVMSLCATHTQVYHLHELLIGVQQSSLHISYNPTSQYSINMEHCSINFILFSLCKLITCVHFCVLDVCMHHCLSFNLILQSPRQNARVWSQWEISAHHSYTSKLQRDWVSWCTISFQFDIEYSSSSEYLTQST